MIEKPEKVRYTGNAEKSECIKAAWLPIFGGG